MKYSSAVAALRNSSGISPGNHLEDADQRSMATLHGACRHAWRRNSPHRAIALAAIHQASSRPNGQCGGEGASGIIVSCSSVPPSPLRGAAPKNHR